MDVPCEDRERKHVRFLVILHLPVFRRLVVVDAAQTLRNHADQTCNRDAG
jgi:hypothetical protein